MIRRIIVFGASGDVASRYFLPAVARLQAEQRLPKGFSALGLARQGWTSEQFQRHILERAGARADLDQAAARALASRASYARTDLKTSGEVVRALGRLTEAEECWRIVTPILEAWQANRVKLVEYPAGSTGPS